uniref:UBC core domain-containing protein n=1 Tax=Arcella intermedia TaxID=1963864 RepID=A0A6B2LB88_9EUKA
MSSPAVRRILKEIKELRKVKSSLFVAAPLEDNIFEWHFTMRGPRNSEFENGIYHGKIILPSDYPLKPPDIIFLTPNGRFEVDKKICLTISSHHAETWRPSWGVRTAILAIIGFFPTRGDGAIASLDWPKTVRQKLARESMGWKCEKCGCYNITALPEYDENEEEVKEIDGLSNEIKLKNKEEQEKDEAEKKRKEQEAQGQQSQAQLPETQQQDPQVQETQQDTTNLTPSIPTTTGIHQRPTSADPSRENALPNRSPGMDLQFQQPHTGSAESPTQTLDIFILVVAFCLFLVLFFKFLP